GDMSVTGWQLMALKSGQMSGLRVDRKVLRAVEGYLDASEAGTKSGKYGYLPNRNAGYTPAMTAVGALCRQYLGVNPLNKNLQNSVEYIKDYPPGSAGLYYEYYATQVMHHMGGPAWDYWNKGGTTKGGQKFVGIRDSLLARQVKTGANASTWPGTDHVG